MTDEQLEQRLRDWYRAEIPADETAPAGLRSGLAAIPRASSAPSRRLGSRRGFTLLAAAAMVGAGCRKISPSAESCVTARRRRTVCCPQARSSHLRSRPSAWPATVRSPFRWKARLP